MNKISKHFVPNLATLAILGLFLLAHSTWVLSAPSHTKLAVPAQIGYQGQLTDDAGDPVADGVYSMRFRIYDDATPGTVLWTEDQDVAVTDGRFDVLLGSVTLLDSGVFDNCPCWLGVKVGVDPEMTPRQPLASVPFSLRTDIADASITTVKLASDAVTADKIAVGAVGSTEIADDSVGTVDLGTGVVTADKIAVGAVGSTEIANDSVGAVDLGTGAVTTVKLADGNVTAPKLAPLAANENLKSGGHIVLQPDPNSLVKLAVLRQDDTANNYLDNQVILTGWAVKQGDNMDQMEESISFGINFDTPPIVLVSFAGRSTTPDFSASKEGDWVTAYPYNITTNGFTWRSYKLNGVGHDTGYYFFYTWIAIGTLP